MTDASLPAASFTVIVVGDMNLAIHHPTWYRLVDIISPAEEDFAIKAAPAVIPGVISHFRTPTVRVECRPDRWRAETSAADEAALSLAEKTFANLYNTPVGALGFTFQAHVPTKSPSVGDALASRLAKVKLLAPPSDGGRIEDISIVQRNEYPHKTMTVTIEPSARLKSSLFVSIQFERPMAEENGLFDLSPKIRASYAEDRQEAQRLTTSILEAITD